MEVPKKVVYIYSEQLCYFCNQLPTMRDRASRVQDLMKAYHLMENNNLLVVESMDATEDELKSFHSSNYIDFIKKMNNLEEFDEYEEELMEFGLEYDCALLPQTFDLIKSLAGGSLTAAKVLTTGKYDIAINWFGGWHHAERDKASGFCYVNDIVLAIQELTKSFNKILYLDLDIHHGDGVQNAFEYSKKILTVSFHKLTPGFFPGSGSLDDTGSSKGKYYTINVPFFEGIGNKTYEMVFSTIFSKIVQAFKPDAFVIQCGADSLNGDKIGQANLTLTTIGKCVKTVLGFKKPSFFCGGGGYNFPHTARLWTYITSIILGETLDDDIPDECEYFTEYGPTYELHIEPSFQKDTNSAKYIKDLINTIISYTIYIENDTISK